MLDPQSEIYSASSTTTGSFLRITSPQALDRNLASRSHLHLVFVASQQRHSDQGRRIKLVDEDRPKAVVPGHLCLIHIEGAHASVCQNTTPDRFPAQVERG